MEPTTIMTAITAAKAAVEAAARIKEIFFDSRKDLKSSSNLPNKPEINLEILQGEIEEQRRQLVEVLALVEENRTVLEKQNQIIIDLSNAVKVTAENVKTLKIITLSAVGVAITAIVLTMFVFFR